jgi:hypothetical protein
MVAKPQKETTAKVSLADFPVDGRLENRGLALITPEPARNLQLSRW